MNYAAGERSMVLVWQRTRMVVRCYKGLGLNRQFVLRTVRAMVHLRRHIVHEGTRCRCVHLQVTSVWLGLMSSIPWQLKYVCVQACTYVAQGMFGLSPTQPCQNFGMTKYLVSSNCLDCSHDTYQLFGKKTGSPFGLHLIYRTPRVQFAPNQFEQQRANQGSEIRSTSREPVCSHGLVVKINKLESHIMEHSNVLCITALTQHTMGT